MNHRATRVDEHEWGCLDCGAEPHHRAWAEPCIRVIEERHIHRDRAIRSTICDGSWRLPSTVADGHGICPVCDGPFLLDAGRVPSHHQAVS